jgi:hypothetical protein
MRSLARGFTTGLLLALCLVSFGLAAPLLAAGAPPILWSRQFGTATADEATAVAVDGSHNAFVGGNTAGDLYGPNAGLWDGFLRKYNYQGAVLWTTQFGTPESDKVYDVTTDGSGGAYVVGYTGPLSRPGAHDTDAYVRRYDASGGLVWTQTFGSQADDSAYGVAVDRSGNAYVAGQTAGSLFAANAGSADVFLCKYDANNNLVWGRQVGSAGGDWAGRHCVALDPSGNIYISGGTDGNLGGLSPGYNCMFLIKYTPEGNLAWKKQYDEGQWAAAEGLTADTLGHLFVSGSVAWGAVRRLDTDGNIQWIRATYGYSMFPGGAPSRAVAVALDGAGNACLAGENSDLNYNAAIWQVDASGNPLWGLVQATSQEDRAIDVAVDSWDRIYVVGWTDGSLFGVNPSPGYRQAFVEVLPEPATLSLLALGGLALLGRRRA